MMWEMTAAEHGTERMRRFWDRYAARYAQALPFAGSSFDTVVCTLGLCSVPDDCAAMAEMHRVLRPGGELLLFDHVAAPNWLLRAGQHLVELVTVRLAGDYQTRRPLPQLQRAGFTIVDSQRTKAGTVERLRALRARRDTSLP